MILLIAPLIGIASALLTIFLTPNLQHYFWRRQQLAARQLEVIHQMNTLAAEVQFLHTKIQERVGREEPLLTAFARAKADVEALFSEHTRREITELLMVMARVLKQPVEKAIPEDSDEVDQIGTQLRQAHLNAICLMYRDMGIPPPPLGQWLHGREECSPQGSPPTPVQSTVWTPMQCRVSTSGQGMG
jgi:hypothetical protein